MNYIGYMKTTSNKTAYQQDKINIAFDVEIPILIDNAVAALHYIRTEPPIVGHVPFCYSSSYSAGKENIRWCR